MALLAVVHMLADFFMFVFGGCNGLLCGSVRGDCELVAYSA